MVTLQNWKRMCLYVPGLLSLYAVKTFSALLIPFIALKHGQTVIFLSPRNKKKKKKSYVQTLA